MTNTLDEEEQLRAKLADLDVPEPPAVERMLKSTVRQANAQTGARDLMTLAISSFFAFLLVFCAPIVAASAAKKKQLQAPQYPKNQDKPK